MDIWRFTVALDLLIFINFLANLSYNFKNTYPPFPNCDQLKLKPIKSNFIRNENEKDTRLDPWKLRLTKLHLKFRKQQDTACMTHWFCIVLSLVSNWSI